MPETAGMREGFCRRVWNSRTVGFHVWTQESILSRHAARAKFGDVIELSVLAKNSLSSLKWRVFGPG